MSILSSDGKFEITGISFAPNVIVFGEQTAYSIKIKNKTGSKITKLCIRLSFAYPTTTNWSTTGYINIFGELKTDSGWLEVVGSTNWANNAEQTFTGNITFNPGTTAPYFEGRVFPEADLYGLSATIYYGDNSSGFKHLDRSGVLYMVDAHYSPTISVFGVERAIDGVVNDEGQNMLATLALKCSEKTRREFVSMRLTYKDKAKPETTPVSIDLNSLIDAALAAEIKAAINETLDKNSDWDLELWFGDQYESVKKTLVLSRSFANVHLSGASTGGVCFGSFSKATENNPVFQCYYPAEFYGPVQFQGGVSGMTDYATEEVNTGGKWIDGKPIYKRSFVFEGVSIASGTNTTELCIIDNFAEIDAVINITGAIDHDNEIYGLDRFYSTSAFVSPFINSSGSLRLRSATSSTVAMKRLVCTIEYTKV